MEFCHKCSIVHEDRNCPLCEANSEIESLEKQIEELKEELESEE